MAIPKVQITGKVLGPDGIGVAGGEIVAALSFPGTVRDSSGNIDQRVGGTERFAIGIDGSVAGLTLVPNDAITPSGSFWTVTFRLPNGITWFECWQLATGTPLEIGDVPIIAPIPAGLRLMVPFGDAEPDVEVPGSRRGELVIVAGGPGEEDHAYLVLKGWDDVYRPKSIAAGGGPP